MKLQFFCFSFLYVSVGYGLFSQQSFIPYMENVEMDAKTKEWNLRYPLISFIQDNSNELNANTTKIYGGWNEQYLYILFDVKDKNLVQLTNDSSKAYLNDAVEFFIDPFRDSKQKMDVNDYQFIVNLNNQVSILKGDYRKTDSVDILAPKEHGLTTLVFKSKTQLLGSLNHPSADTGYIVEMAIPFSAIGIEPKEGITFKADFCLNDADSLVDIAPIPDTAEVPGFYYSSWKGSRDFSFPSEWSVYNLKGKPSWFNQILRKHAVKLLVLALVLVLFFLVIIIRQRIRIKQLKNVPQKSSIPQFHHIQNYLDHKEPADETESNEIISEIEKDAPIHVQEPLVINKARNYILSNIENEISVEKLASECAVSSRQLQRIFKEHLSITPMGFLVILKMEEAEKLLKSGAYNVTEVAYHLGYSDAAYFTRVFKKYFGYPPSKMIR